MVKSYHARDNLPRLCHCLQSVSTNERAPVTTEPKTYITPEPETNIATEKKPGRAKIILMALMAWTVLVSLWVADGLIWLMLRTRTNERRIKPTERIPWRQGLKRELMSRQNNTCVYCGHRRTARLLEIDHIFPVVRGGSNNKSNLQVICRPCNMRKGIQSDVEFRARYSRLVPSKPMTPPRRRIAQHEFNAATQHTSQADSVRSFRKTRYLSSRDKVVGGCTFLGIAVLFVMLISLALLGLEGLLLLFPPIVLGVAVGVAIWLRASITGVMID